MVVAGTDEAVLMVESEAKELNEDLMLGAVLFGHQETAIITGLQSAKVLVVWVDEWSLKMTQRKVVITLN